MTVNVIFIGSFIRIDLSFCDLTLYFKTKITYDLNICCYQEFNSLALCIASSLLLTCNVTATIIDIVITYVKFKCERDVSPDTFKK